MRIAFYTSTLDRTGGFFRCFFLAKHLAARGHRTEVLCGSWEPRLGMDTRREDGVLVRTLPRVRPGAALPAVVAADMARLALAASHLARNPPDIVHAFGLTIPSSAGIAVWARLLQAAGRGRMVADWEDWWGRGGIWTEYPAYLRWPGTALEEVPVTMAPQVTVVSDALAERAAALGVPRARIHWIPNGANVEGVPVVDRDEARRRVGLPPGGHLVVHVGYTHETAFRTLLEAFAKAAREFPGAQLALIGRLPAAYATVARERGLADRVRFVGPVPYTDMPWWLGAADVLALAMQDSVIEAGRWPIRLGDYLAAARPVVATDLGEVAKAVRACQCGLLAPPLDAATFGDHLARLLGDEAERERLGHNGRRGAETIYAWRGIAERLERVYTTE